MAGRLRNMLCAALTGFAVLVPLSLALASNDDVYTVGNYPVDAQAANAVAAKDKALAEGQQAAFRSLLKRVVPVTDYERLKRLTVLRSSAFFEGVSVRSEPAIPPPVTSRSLDFSFRPISSVPSCSRRASPSSRSRRARSPSSRSWRGAGRARHWQRRAFVDRCLEGPRPRARYTDRVATVEARHPFRHAADADRWPRLRPSAFSPASMVRRLRRRCDRRARCRREPPQRHHGRHRCRRPVQLEAQLPRVRRRYRLFHELAAVVGQGVLEGRWKVLQAGAWRPSHGGASVSPCRPSTAACARVARDPPAAPRRARRRRHPHRIQRRRAPPP